MENCGLSIFCPHADEDGKPRIWLSPGTGLAQTLNPRVPYGKSSFIPREPWRQATSQETKELLCTEASDDIGHCVGIVKISSEALRPLHALRLAHAPSEAAILQMVKSEKYPPAKTILAEYLIGYRHKHGDEKIHDPIVNGPGLTTTTYDYQNKYFLGLHLDSWNNMPYDLRHQSPNRISVNLGLQDRYFLFIGIPFATVMERAGYTSPPNPQDVPTTDIIKSFLARFPDQPVVKVRVSPGEAYIAPTENIIHDGSSEGQTGPDIHFTIRGYFGFTRAVEEKRGFFSKLVNSLRR